MRAAAVHHGLGGEHHGHHGCGDDDVVHVRAAAVHDGLGGDLKCDDDDVLKLKLF